MKHYFLAAALLCCPWCRPPAPAPAPVPLGMAYWQPRAYRTPVRNWLFGRGRLHIVPNHSETPNGSPGGAAGAK